MQKENLSKIIFDGELPRKVRLCTLIYSVRKFEFNPKRCFRCSLYRHFLDSCSKKIICAFCGKNHFLAECSVKKGGSVPICFHCKNIMWAVQAHVFSLLKQKKLKILGNKVKYHLISQNICITNQIKAVLHSELLAVILILE